MRRLCVVVFIWFLEEASKRPKELFKSEEPESFCGDELTGGVIVKISHLKLVIVQLFVLQQYFLYRYVLVVQLYMYMC